MKTVNRNTEPCPAVLAATEIAPHVATYAASTSTSKVKKHVYGHVDVATALHRLFLRKCSLCEADASKDSVVEHFIPHCPERAELAYDWTNLHWTCQSCNQRKKRDAYKEYRPASKVVERTLPLDATAPHGGRVEDMLWFDENLRAHPTAKYSGDVIVQRTAEFLNASLPENQRLRMSQQMMAFIAPLECLSEWRLLIPLLPSVPEERPDPARTAGALAAADRLYLLFLHEKNPFSTSLRWVLQTQLGLDFNAIAQLGRHYRNLGKLTAAY